MCLAIRPFHHFSIRCPVAYKAGLFEGRSAVWDFSIFGASLLYPANTRSSFMAFSPLITLEVQYVLTF